MVSKQLDITHCCFFFYRNVKRSFSGKPNWNNQLSDTTVDSIQCSVVLKSKFQAESFKSPTIAFKVFFPLYCTEPFVINVITRLKNADSPERVSLIQFHFSSENLVPNQDFFFLWLSALSHWSHDARRRVGVLEFKSLYEWVMMGNTLSFVS